jgi:hypothetical protein
MPWMPDRVRHDEKRLQAVFIVIFIIKAKSILLWLVLRIPALPAFDPFGY